MGDFTHTKTIFGSSVIHNFRGVHLLIKILNLSSAALKKQYRDNEKNTILNFGSIIRQYFQAGRTQSTIETFYLAI